MSEAPKDHSDSASQAPDPQSVEGLFVAALNHQPGEQRIEFLKDACGDADAIDKVVAGIAKHKKPERPNQNKTVEKDK